MTNAKCDDGGKDAGDSGCPAGAGIPRGNTVVVVGDPGTGKTTFLLTYVSRGIQKLLEHNTPEDGSSNKEEKFTNTVRLAPDDAAGASIGMEDLEDELRTYRAIDQLFVPSLSHRQMPLEGAEGQKGTLRCFITLENSLSRVIDNHESLLNKWVGKGSDDQFVVIDATAFLSGRLEDRLRYPQLIEASDQRWVQANYDLNLGGHYLYDDEHFGLYFQPTNQDPIRIEQLATNVAPFSTSGPDESNIDGPIQRRSFNIVTRPVPDPLQRVRLLKDLLAQLFVRFPKCGHRVIAIDSLTALMNSLVESEPPVSESSPRRLHILSLVRWLEEAGATTFMACEADRGTNNTWGGHPLFLGTEERYLASGVIQLNYHEYPSGDMVRFLRVLKMRGAAHDMRPHAYDLGADGISWVEPLFGEARIAR